jgi:hypothetical protein
VLKTAHISNTPSVKRLLKIWAQRYTPDLSPLTSKLDTASAYASLSAVSSVKNRAVTAAKLGDFLVEIRCQMAEIQTNFLYSYLPHIVNSSEARQLSRYASLIYKKMMEMYQQPSNAASLAEMPTNQDINSLNNWLATLGIPIIEKLATEIEPLLLEYQEQHLASKDWRTLGFITTLLNFSNEFMLKKLTPPEQVLMKPYFQFIEEQVALPWERVCAAAASYSLASPEFIVVEQMLPHASEIAQIVYHKLVKLLPHHYSRRGGLQEPGIIHSCLRDLQMFQAYLWLCFLEKNLAPIEEELLDLCVMVMTGVKVKWEMIELCNEILCEEILSYLTPEQQSLVKPYTNGLQQAFKKEQNRFQITPNYFELSAEQQKRFQTRGPGSFFYPKHLIGIVD